MLCYDSHRAAAVAAQYDVGSDDDEGGVDPTDGYFVSSCVLVGDTAQSLDDYLYSQEQFAVWGGYATAQALDTDWPISVISLIEKGWIPFFDQDSNECVWMFLLTGETEASLPVGADYDMCVYVGLEQCEYDCVDWTWLRPPQVARRAWVMVRVPGGGAGGEREVLRLESFAECEGKTSRGGGEDQRGDAKGKGRGGGTGSGGGDTRAATKDMGEWLEGVGGSGCVESGGDGDGEMWYYFNRVSGHSCWEEPLAWEQLVAEAGGWVLCAEEGRPEDLYWWVTRRLLEPVDQYSVWVVLLCCYKLLLTSSYCRWHVDTNEIKWYSEDYD